jgi:hypothetical protein
MVFNITYQGPAELIPIRHSLYCVCPVTIERLPNDEWLTATHDGGVFLSCREYYYDLSGKKSQLVTPLVAGGAGFKFWAVWRKLY